MTWPGTDPSLARIVRRANGDAPVIDPKYKSVELAWVRIGGEWQPTVVLDGIPVQVEVNPTVGIGPLIEEWGPRFAPMPAAEAADGGAP